MKNRIFVGLSGGVDSAVSAAILRSRGFDVVGAFIKIWRPEFTECTWKEDRLDAMRVCAALSIPFREVDLSEQYKKEVVDSMIRDYQAGITPNPDVLCNSAVKFGAFAKWATQSGASLIATGHYARIKQVATHFELLRGADPEKDQSYFLYRMTQADLAHTLFPVGEMKKPQVRAAAKKFNLPVADKHDSQGLCFVGDVSMPDFLRRFIPVETGAVLDAAGKEIGEHEGAALYTLGERHGFTITEKNAAATPHYIIAVNVEKNTITVSPKREDAESTRAVLQDVHAIYRPPMHGTEIEIQARYREKPVRAVIQKNGGETVVQSSEPRIFPPGQSLVFYKGAVCLGGGIIGQSGDAERVPSAVFAPGSAVTNIVRRVQ
ncbi:MAG TPA: tRNA 2-thiouridine(34) synthase MnmA [Candidatus Paceibacterota bacterium]|nr:tRNA 2-thiouridine(34) synthase MnmA [Candidatus Paceibacterota bacterium]